eukprot:TRINITY_DN55414_c0_g1_i1.p1 TRINITY_DN55414_c0_g1~~TRINITY_DN55414_c0_g1_i1.p1  ORF type:complete len:777 (+),score=290.43 TRINITY_DN55414_c0_g1_i1:163-2493(+)
MADAQPPPSEQAGLLGQGPRGELDGDQIRRLFGPSEPREITPFYRAFIAFMRRKDMVRELEQKKLMQDSVPLLDPNSSVSKGLRSVCVFAILYNVLTVPFRFAYDISRSPAVWLTLDALMDVPLIIRLVTSFLAPYKDQAQQDMVRNKRLIARQYLCGDFALDLLTVLPLDHALQDVRWRFFRFLALKRLDRLQKHWESQSLISPVAYRLLYMLALLVLVVHNAACLWYFVARDSAEDTAPVVPLAVDYWALARNWTLQSLKLSQKERLETRQLFFGCGLVRTEPTFDTLEVYNCSSAGDDYGRAFELYAYSLYFAIVYLVGYNAGIPRTPTQTIVSIIIVLVGAFAYSGIISVIGAILKDMDRTEQTFVEKVDNARSFMRYAGIPERTKRNVTHFYKHMWESRRALEQLNVLEDAPDPLHRELRAFLHKDFVSQVPLFAGCDDLFLEEVSCFLEYVAVLPEYYIIRKGEVGKEMFFIHRGQVEVVSEPPGEDQPNVKQIVYASLQEGSFFGEVALVVPGAKRTASIRCSTFTELFVLQKVDLEMLLRSYPETKTKIINVAINRKLIEREKAIELGLIEPSPAEEMTIRLRMLIANARERRGQQEYRVAEAGGVKDLVRNYYAFSQAGQNHLVVSATVIYEPVRPKGHRQSAAAAGSPKPGPEFRQFVMHEDFRYAIAVGPPGSGSHVEDELYNLLLLPFDQVCTDYPQLAEHLRANGLLEKWRRDWNPGPRSAFINSLRSLAQSKGKQLGLPESPELRYLPEWAQGQQVQSFRFR